MMGVPIRTGLQSGVCISHALSPCVSPRWSLSAELEPVSVQLTFDIPEALTVADCRNLRNWAWIWPMNSLIAILSAGVIVSPAPCNSQKARNERSSNSSHLSASMKHVQSRHANQAPREFNIKVPTSGIRTSAASKSAAEYAQKTSGEEQKSQMPLLGMTRSSPWHSTRPENWDVFVVFMIEILSMLNAFGRALEIRSVTTENLCTACAHA